jgi:pimeloyl-ACP methyl ester carboxylesterase
MDATEPKPLASRTPLGAIVRRLIVYPLLLLAVVSLPMAIPGIADRLVLFPSTGPTDAMGATRVETPFEGGALEIWTARSPGAARTGRAALYMLGFEGNASRADWSATPDAHLWGMHPVEVWSLNYPGYGGSTGPARLKRLPGAALAAYDALAREAAGRPIVLNGSSLGSTLALYVATQRPVAGVLLRNPPPLQDLILAPRFGWWNLWIGAWIVSGKVPREMNSMLNAPRVTVPAAFILSTDDEVVPPRYQERVVAAYAGEKTRIVLTGATHNAAFDGSHRAELHSACAWLWERCAPREGEPGGMPL